MSDEATTETHDTKTNGTSGRLVIRQGSEGMVPEGIDDIAPGNVDARAALLLQAIGFGQHGAADMQADDEGQQAPKRPDPKAKAGSGETSSADPVTEVVAGAAEVAKAAPAAAKAAPPPAEVSDEAPAEPAKSAESRAERFRRLREEDRAKRAYAVEQKQVASRMAEVERMYSTLSEQQKQVAPLLDIVKTRDPVKLHEFMSEHFSPEDLAAATATWTSDASREKWRAKSIRDEALSLANEKIEKLERLIQEQFVAPKQQTEAATKQRAVYDSFADVVKRSGSDVAPYATQLLERDADALYALADATANRLTRTKGEGNFTFYDVIDAIERTYHVPQTTKQQESQAAQSVGKSANQNAAAKATTITNRHAAETSAVNDAEESNPDDSLDARVKRLTSQWNGASLKQHRFG